jgi:predicted benzoate:H+ symporter BenE
MGESSGQVAIATLKALGSGKAMVVSGLVNKVMAALASKLPKPLVARMAGIALKRYRMRRAKT